MARSPCCEKVGLKKGPWTSEEDQKLLAYIEQHGHGSWRALPAKAGLQRCGKSCRLRWINYLRPDIKRGKFSLQEEQTIIQLHALLGNRWSAIAAYLPKRTDNEIKNYWNTHLKKRPTKMGIDPVTHKRKTNALGSAIGQTKDAANLSHMAQWECARLEAEARLVRESKLVTTNPSQDQLIIGSSSFQIPNKATPLAARPKCLDVLKAWQGVVSGMFGIARDLESPTSNLNFHENILAIPKVGGFGGHNFVENSLPCFEKPNQMQGLKEKLDSSPMALHHDNDQMTYSSADDQGCSWFQESFRTAENIMEGLSDILVCESSAGHHQQSSSMEGENSNNNAAYNPNFEVEDNTNYWNSMLNLVNASATWSPVLAIPKVGGFGGHNFVENSLPCFEKPNQMQGLKEKLDSSSMALHHDNDQMTYSSADDQGCSWFQESFRTAENIMEGLSDLLVCESSAGHHQQSSSMEGENSNNNAAYNPNFEVEDNTNYWNSMLKTG